MLANPQQLAALVEMFHTGTRQEYAKGEFLVRPSDPPPGVFFVESGLVKAYDITKYGEENLLIIRRSGEILGLTWAITGRARDVIYTALAPTTVWLISRADFLAYLQYNPIAAVPVVSLLADMYRIHGERIMTLEYRTVRERLASFLLNMADRFGETTANGTLINAPLRHQDIASSISATRETTSRTLSELEHKGIIRNEQSHLLIRNFDALNAIVQ
jgi:CRP/FNR family transcriptional regulator